MAISTPERDPSTTPFSIELAAPLKKRARKPTEKSEQYRRSQEQPDPSADESDDIQVESSQRILQTKKNTTNKDLLAALTEVIQLQNETIKKLERETREIRQKQ